MPALEKWRWAFAKALPAIAIVLVGVVIAGVVWLILRPDTHQDASPSTTKPSVVTAQSDPPKLVNDKREIVRVVEQFVTRYLSRDAQLLSGTLQDRDEKYREKLRDYVTKDFLENYMGSPLDTPADDALLKSDGVQSVLKVEFTDGDVEHGIPVTITCRVTKNDAQPSVFMKEAEVTLVLVSDQWKVNTYDETYR